MSDPVTAVPDELRTAPTRPVGALGLLRLHDFRNVFLAVAASEVGDALALAGSLWIAVAGAFAAALGQSSAVVLLNSAAQEEVPDSLLGRVIGLISLTHRGGHATALLLVSPLFAVHRAACRLRGCDARASRRWARGSRSLGRPRARTPPTRPFGTAPQEPMTSSPRRA